LNVLLIFSVDPEGWVEARDYLMKYCLFYLFLLPAGSAFCPILAPINFISHQKEFSFKNNSPGKYPTGPHCKRAYKYPVDLQYIK
jgi:hypothetical protein